MRKTCRAGLRSACVQSQCLLLRPAVLSFISEPGGRGCDDRSNRLDGAVKVWKLLTTAMIDPGRFLQIIEQTDKFGRNPDRRKYNVS